MFDLILGSVLGFSEPKVTTPKICQEIAVELNRAAAEGVITKEEYDQIYNRCVRSYK